jgi:hypothetical protein
LLLNIIESQYSTAFSHPRLGNNSLANLKRSSSPNFTMSQSARKRKTLDDSVLSIAQSLNSQSSSVGGGTFTETLMMMEQNRLDRAEAENRRAEKRAEEREETRLEREARSDRQMMLMMMMMTGKVPPNLDNMNNM